jgi:glycosyltransferase involved in cell wall biosynthesis
MALMDWPRDCAAVIPCFNEAARVRRVVTDVRRHLPKVIVVDDGSADATVENAEGAGAEVLRLPKNLGKGAAMRCGWQRAQRSGFKWALMLDGDGQHAADDVPKFFDCAEATGAELVVGNRMDNAASMPLVRCCANRWMSRRISKLTGADLPDSQCGFRLAHLKALLSRPLRANRFEIESAMLVAFLAAGKRVEFVPVQTIYEGRASKIRPLADSWRWLCWRLAQRAPMRASNTIHLQWCGDE